MQKGPEAAPLEAIPDAASVPALLWRVLQRNGQRVVCTRHVMVLVFFGTGPRFAIPSSIVLAFSINCFNTIDTCTTLAHVLVAVHGRRSDRSLKFFATTASHGPCCQNLISIVLVARLRLRLRHPNHIDIRVSFLTSE